MKANLPKSIKKNLIEMIKNSKIEEVIYEPRYSEITYISRNDNFSEKWIGSTITITTSLQKKGKKNV